MRTAGHVRQRFHASLVVAALALAPRLASSQAREPIEELVVTASAMPIAPEKVGSAVTVITAADLERRQIRYVADALRHVPGVAVNRAGSFGGLTQVRLRGAEANHVLVLIDGVEAADASSGELDLSSLLAEGIERIEVLRGPQSGLYGANAMAGVISVITASGGGGPALGLAAETGSFGALQTDFSARGATDRARGALTLAYREAEGPNVSAFGDEDDADENVSLTGRGTFAVSERLALDGAFRFSDKHSDIDTIDFSGGPTQGLTIDSPDFSDTVGAQASAGATWSLDDGGWVTRLAGSYFSGELDGGGTSAYGSATTRERLALQSTVELAGGADAAHFVTGFLEHETETYRNRYPFDPSQAPELERDVAGIGVEYRAELGSRLYLSATLRSDSNDGFEDATTHRVTASYLAGRDGARVHASYGRGVTNPTFFEQFGFIPGSFVGNPSLVPEEVNGWDVGWEQRFGGDRLTLDATYFDADLRNEITDAFPSVVNDDGVSERRGVELALRGRLTERLALGAAFTYTDATDPDGTREVRRPKRTASIDLDYRAVSERVRLYASIVHNSAMLDTDFRNFYTNGFMAERTMLDGYTLVNVGGSVQVGGRVEVYARIDNLFDEDYEELLSYNTPGRGIFAGFRWQLLSGR